MGWGKTHRGRPATLAEAGINKNLAHEGRKLGALSEPEFEQAVETARSSIGKVVKAAPAPTPWPTAARLTGLRHVSVAAGSCPWASTGSGSAYASRGLPYSPAHGGPNAPPAGVTRGTAGRGSPSKKFLGGTRKPHAFLEVSELSEVRRPVSREKPPATADPYGPRNDGGDRVREVKNWLPVTVRPMPFGIVHHLWPDNGKRIVIAGIEDAQRRDTFWVCKREIDRRGSGSVVRDRHDPIKSERSDDRFHVAERCLKL